MFKCVLLLAVLGFSTSYHHHGYGHYPAQTAQPSRRPDQWSHPGYEGHHETSQYGWHFQHGSERFNPSGSYTGDIRQWPKPSFDDDSDYHSDTDSDDDDTDQGGNVSDETNDKIKNPLKYDQVQESTGKWNDTLERGIGQSNITGQIAVTNSTLFKLNDRNDTLNREPFGANVNQSKLAESTKNQTGSLFINPVANVTNETNATLTEAYITGPDNTLIKNLSANNTKLNQTDSLKPIGTSVHKPIKSSDVLVITAIEPDDDFIPTVPAPIPGIGSIPVPVLGQFLAPSLQWNVGIYTKMMTPYSQICSGSLVKTDAVLTAAHCFWSEGEGGALRPALFAAAAGKLLRAWEDAGDAFAQKSDIKAVHIPPRFRGAMTSFQDDIAIARLTTPFELAPGVKPVCVDFDLALEREQLQRDGSKGTLVGWGLTEPNGPPSEGLNYLELPYLDITECLKLVPSTFIKYITSDKICAGDFTTGVAACKGDSGGGLVYTSNNVPYIRGIASTAPRDADKNDCNPYTPATFTQITAHMAFLTDHIPNIAEGCRMLYEVQNTTVENSTGNIENSGTNFAGNCRTTYEVQNKTVESSAGYESGNRNVSGQLKSNVTAQSERKSDWVPKYLNLNTNTGQQHECNCFCN